MKRDRDRDIARETENENEKKEDFYKAIMKKARKTKRSWENGCMHLRIYTKTDPLTFASLAPGK